MSAKKKTAKRKKPRSKDDEMHFAVYLEPMGRQEVGIVRCFAQFAGDRAFVQRKWNTKQADILPATNVFKTHAEAEKYLAGTGVPHWVVGTQSVKFGNRTYNLPVMCRCLVLKYSYFGRWGGEGRTAYKNLDDTPMVDFNDYSARAYKTKKEAEAQYVKDYRAAYKNNQADISYARQLHNLLLARAPRTRGPRKA